MGTALGAAGVTVLDDVPVFDTVYEAVDATGADTSVIFVPAAFAADEKKDGSGDLPNAASIAFATAIGRDVIKLTNSNWVIRADTLAADLGMRTVRLVNDFEAVAFAVSRLPQENLPLLFGEDKPFPYDGGVTVMGPGTGLGVAHLHRLAVAFPQAAVPLAEHFAALAGGTFQSIDSSAEPRAMWQHVAAMAKSMADSAAEGLPDSYIF